MGRLFLHLIKMPTPALLFVSGLAIFFTACFFSCAHARDAAYAPSSLQDSEMPQVIELNLTEAVHLAMRRNRNIESAYLNRILQKFDLGRERTKFHPNLEISPRAGGEVSGSSTRYDSGGPDSTSTRGHSAGASVVTSISQKIPTGAEITFAWTNRIEGRDSSTDGTSRNEETGLMGWSVGFRQPLLKNAGIRYNTASLVRAALREEDNRRALRDTLIDTVNGVIKDYRGLMLARQNHDLAREALDKAVRHLEDTRVLIAAGRRAANESLQAEADLARKELDMESARQDLDNAQLELLRRLELDSETVIVPTETVELRPVEPVFDQCLQLARDRNQGYLRSMNDLELAKISLEDVKNQRLWDLDLEGSYTDGLHHRHPETGYRRDDWRVGMTLTIPLPIYGNAKYDRERPLLAAKIDLRRAEMSFQTADEDLENRVRRAVRQVETGLKQVRLALRAVELSEQTFQFSELKYRMGQMSNTSFITEQDKLRDSRNSLNRSIINYQNALTDLDGLLATTLETWGIDFTPERTDLEEEFLGGKTWMLDRRTAKDPS